MLWQNFTQLLALFRICCDAEIDLNDVCHLDQWLVAGAKDEVVECDLIAELFELLHCFEDFGRGLYVFENLHNDVFWREKLWRTV